MPAPRFIDDELLAAFSIESFRGTSPFPWSNFERFLTDDGFEALCSQFPPLELFEKHVDFDRAFGQRPHNRYYLALESSIYHDGENGVGVVARSELPGPWQAFLEELTGSRYREFVGNCLGTDDLDVRYAWHVGEAGSEVSAHVDAPEKVGTHIFYLNRDHEWDPSWGGATLILGDRTTTAMNPEFDDFDTVIAAETVGNRSLLFRNNADAWHGVRALDCPPGAQRRLFNVIFDRRGSHTDKASQAVSPAPLRLYGRFRSRVERTVRAART